MRFLFLPVKKPAPRGGKCQAPRPTGRSLFNITQSVMKKLQGREEREIRHSSLDILFPGEQLLQTYIRALLIYVKLCFS